MHTPKALLQRLDEIGQSLKNDGQALALLGLGSAGIETDRLDAYSDLDFFTIVEQGQKQRFIECLDWLEAVHEVSYCFANTVDGYKLMYSDGIFCEFAVFEPHELNDIPFTPGRIVWQQGAFDNSCCQPRINKAPPPSSDLEWIIGEALTNLHVGMCRNNRGEKLSGFKFVQHFAFDRLVDLVSKTEQAQPALVDPFMLDRRIELRYPKFAKQLPSFTQGYERNAQSALAQLEFLNTHFEINQAMRTRIMELCKHK